MEQLEGMTVFCQQKSKRKYLVYYKTHQFQRTDIMRLDYD